MEDFQFIKNNLKLQPETDFKSGTGASVLNHLEPFICDTNKYSTPSIEMMAHLYVIKWNIQLSRSKDFLLNADQH